MPLPTFLRPAWIDEGRHLAQERAFRRLLGDLEFQGTCLNAGCGEGLYAEFLESFSGLREIVDMDLAMPAFVARRADRRHRAERGSLTALPFERARFDCCLCSEVLEHVEDDRTGVRELARVIKPGGWLLVSVPHPPAPSDPSHVREGYTLPSLRALLEGNGFQVLRHIYALRLFMRLNYELWAWQFRTIGKGTRSYCPRGLVRGLARLDRLVPIGRPWNLAVIAARVV